MKRNVVLALFLLASVFVGAMHLIGRDAASPEEARKAFAMAKMVTGLFLLWVCLAGGAMYRFRETVRTRVLALGRAWQLKFVGFATLLACAEEAITVAMTNLAPAFGSKLGEAYITASTNYFDVIFFHSVVVFIPTFIAWSLLLKRYDFSPFAVFFLHGIVGTLAEVTMIGPGALAMFPFWLFVYGLMVYLPAYCLPDPETRGARSPRWFHHLFAVPAVFVLAMPLLAPLVYFITVVLKHPSIDF